MCSGGTTPASAETTISRGAAVQEVDQCRNRTLEANATPGLHQMFRTNAAKFRIVADQIGQLAALLHEIAVGKPGDTVLKSGYAQQLAQYESRIFETQRLVEI